jgi:hypothetical protein
LFDFPYTPLPGSLVVFLLQPYNTSLVKLFYVLLQKKISIEGGRGIERAYHCIEAQGGGGGPLANRTMRVHKGESGETHQNPR